MLVKKIMSEKLVMLNPGQTIRHAAKQMAENNISGLIVVEKGKAVGILTMKDILKKAVSQDKDLHKTLVRDIMTSPAITISPLSKVESAAKKMREKNVKRLVVVNSENRVAGIITAMDIISNLPGLMEVMFDTWVKPVWR